MDRRTLSAVGTKVGTAPSMAAAEARIAELSHAAPGKYGVLDPNPEVNGAEYEIYRMSDPRPAAEG